jgi:hypothetical protein
VFLLNELTRVKIREISFGQLPGKIIPFVKEQQGLKIYQDIWCYMPPFQGFNPLVFRFTRQCPMVLHLPLEGI